jgi:hypothetical protein
MSRDLFGEVRGVRAVRTVHGVLVRGARRALRVLVRTERRTHPA